MKNCHGFVEGYGERGGMHVIITTLWHVPLQCERVLNFGHVFVTSWVLHRGPIGDKDAVIESCELAGFFTRCQRICLEVRNSCFAPEVATAGDRLLVEVEQVRPWQANKAWQALSKEGLS
jgi:hypothetical protein